MTLTEFLLARFDEDEVSAHRAASALTDRGSSLYEGTPPGWVAHVRGTGSPERLVEDVRAKREIVRLLELQQTTTPTANICLEGLLVLAKPYAWHEDYRPEWRI